MLLARRPAASPSISRSRFPSSRRGTCSARYCSPRSRRDRRGRDRVRVRRCCGPDVGDALGRARCAASRAIALACAWLDAGDLLQRRLRVRRVRRAGAAAAPIRTRTPRCPRAERDLRRPSGSGATRCRSASTGRRSSRWRRDGLGVAPLGTLAQLDGLRALASAALVACVLLAYAAYPGDAASAAARGRARSGSIPARYLVRGRRSQRRARARRRPRRICARSTRARRSARGRRRCRGAQAARRRCGASRCGLVNRRARAGAVAGIALAAAGSGPLLAGVATALAPHARLRTRRPRSKPPWSRWPSPFSATSGSQRSWRSAPRRWRACWLAPEASCGCAGAIAKAGCISAWRLGCSCRIRTRGTGSGSSPLAGARAGDRAPPPWRCCSR